MANTTKIERGFHFSGLNKVKIGEGDDATTTVACIATYYDERVGTVVRGAQGVYVAFANRDDDGNPVGLMAGVDGLTLTTRKGTSYDATVAAIRATDDGFPGDPNATDEDLPLFDRSHRIEALVERIVEIKDRMGPESARTAVEVLESILNPLLTQLGWKLDDPRAVVAGYETKLGRVDLALCHPGGHPCVLVQIEGPEDTDRGQDRHPFDDCTTGAIQLALSDGGREWRFHLPAGPGSIENREFARFDIVFDPVQQVAEVMEDHIARHAVKSGEAQALAERRYRDVRFPAEALAAWHRALLGSEIRGRFLSEIEMATGTPADSERAEKFIRGQIDSVHWPADPPNPRPARRVEVGDVVWVYDFATREMAVHVVVGTDPDWEKGQVSRESPFGHALLGAREGEVKEFVPPNQAPRRVRVVLIKRESATH